MSEPHDLDQFTLDQLRRELDARAAAGALVLGGGEAPQTDPDLAAFATGQIFEALRARQKVVYGTDDRLDLYQVGDLAVLRDADTVVAIFDAASVSDNGDGTVTLATTPFVTAGGQPLCPNEPFRGQPTGAGCSGFLVAPDLVVTAGHCVDAATLPGLRFVFGFRMLDPLTARTTLPAGEVYSGVAVVDHRLLGGGADWAVVRLDRPVTNHAIAPLRRTGQIGDNQPVHVIGHPVGLPLKYAAGAQVRDNSHAAFFVANLDTYGGNSGSPVFNSITHEVEGVLVRGEQDFVSRGTCTASLICPPTGCRGEDVTRATEFAASIPEAVAPPPPPLRWHGWRPIGATTFPYNAPIGAAVSTPGEVDLFAVAPDGRILTNHWRETFRDWDQIDEGFAAPASPVTAITREPGVVDVFVVGNDRRIYASWWDGDWHPWMAVSGGFAPLKTRIDAYAPHAEQIVLHVVGTDERIYSCTWRYRWDEWLPIEGAGAPLGTPVSVADNGQLHRFAVGHDGRVNGGAAPPAGAVGPWASLGPLRAPLKAPITAIVGDPGAARTVELFVVGDDGHIATHTIGGPTAWTPLGTLRAVPGNTVAATWLAPDRLLVAAVANDGQVYTAQRQGDTWGTWELLPGLSAHATTPVTALTLQPEGRVIVAVVGDDGRVYTNHFGV